MDLEKITPSKSMTSVLGEGTGAGMIFIRRVMEQR